MGKKVAAVKDKPRGPKKSAVVSTVQPVPITVRGISFKDFGRRTAQLAVGSSLLELLLIATLCLSRYLQNSDFSYPSEIVLNIVLLGVVVSFGYGVFRLILRSRLAAHIAGLLMAYELYGYSYAFPRFHHWANSLIPSGVTSFTHAALVVLFMAIVFGLIGYGIAWLTRRKQLTSLPLLKIITFVICFVFVVEMGKFGSRLWTIRHDLTYKQPTADLQVTGKVASVKPNVYYLLFDRYANATTLQNDYNYDNSNLLNFLSSQGFSNRTDAYANYPFTMQSVSSTLGLGYHADLYAKFKNDSKGFQTAFPYRTILDNSPAAQAFKASGYNYNQVSSWWDFTRNVPSANDEPSESFRLRLFGKNFWLTDLQRDIVNKSILSPLLLKGVTFGHTVVVQYQLDRNPTQNFNAQMNALKTIVDNSNTNKQPQFTFAHILSPHDPYIFDAQGNAPTYDPNRTDNGVDETVKYTNQITYINTRIKDLISTIRTKDPSAVIVLQADEGPYPKQFRGTLTPGHFYDPINLPLAQEKQKFGVLASYYLPGASTTTSPVTSSVNSLRYVLSNYLGYNLPSLPDCQFAVGDKYNLYNYQLVTGALKGGTNPNVCNQYK